MNGKVIFTCVCARLVFIDDFLRVRNNHGYPDFSRPHMVSDAAGVQIAGKVPQRLYI
jgi:hypothetical protein